MIAIIVTCAVHFIMTLYLFIKLVYRTKGCQVIGDEMWLTFLENLEDFKSPVAKIVLTYQVVRFYVIRELIFNFNVFEN